MVRHYFSFGRKGIPIWGHVRPPSDISSKLGLQGKEDHLVFDLIWPEIGRNPAKNCSDGRTLVLQTKISLTGEILVSAVLRHFTRSPYGFGVKAKILFRSHTKIYVCQEGKMKSSQLYDAQCKLAILWLHRRLPSAQLFLHERVARF